MPRKMSDEAREHKAAYDTAYIMKNIKQKTISFNVTNDEDMKLYEWINCQPNQAQYMKGLIRDDMIHRK